MPQKSGIALKVLLMLFSCASFGLAQQPQAQAAPAPIPSQIFTAKKVFISNVGGDSDISPDHFSGGPDRAYNQFYAGLKAWNRYELVSAPADTELLFELHFTAPPGPVQAGMGSGPSPRFRAVIIDLKTHAVLWNFTEYLYGQKSSGKWTHDKAFDQAMVSLVDDIKKLATPSSGAAPDAKN